MEQPDLFTAKARTTDPVTSHVAAYNVEASGKASTQRRACLVEVRRHPSQTSGEIAQALGMERHIPARRLPELREAGLIKNGAQRKCTIMGTLMMTWEPV